MASKKPKRSTLGDLSRKAPTSEDLQSAIKKFDSMDPRSAALVMCAFLDDLLQKAIAAHFYRPDTKIYASIFSEPNAPLSSFSSKIDLGRALYIYDDSTRKRLHQIRSIRNLFAHTVADYSFDTSEIAEVCKALEYHSSPKAHSRSQELSPRTRFLQAGTVTMLQLGAMIKLRTNMIDKMFEPYK